MTSAAGAPTYRPDIDGLRAVAVAAVVGYHAFPSRVPGGFVGVDVFFVVSGYLITTLVTLRLDAGTFRFGEFYARRARRILPALVVVLAAVWIAGWARLFSDEYRALARHLLAATAFVSNVVLRGEAGYFDVAEGTKPLLHLWSLAIEEQFYLAWPLVLVVVPRRLRVAATAALGLASLGWSATLLPSEPIAACYSPFARGWELMAGALLAELPRLRSVVGSRLREPAAWLGAALVGVACIAFDRDASYPSWRALLPVVGTVLLVAAGPDASINRALARRAVVAIGLVSYPLYLWHWPLLSFVFIDEGVSSPAWMRAAAVGLALALAGLTWRFVERPVRASGDLRRLPLAFVATTGLVALVAWITLANDGFPSRDGTRDAWARTFDDAAPDHRYASRHDLARRFGEECDFYDNAAWRAGRATDVPRATIATACTARPAGATSVVLLWGDSHAQHLRPGLVATLPADVALLQVATSGCPPARAGADDGTPYCRRSNAQAWATVELAHPDIVVVAQQGGHAAPRFRAIAGDLRARGVATVVVVGPVPQWSPDLNRVVARRHWPALPERTADHLDPRTVRTETTLERTRRSDEPFVYVDLFDYLCDARGCRVFADGGRAEDLMTYDYGHLTPSASEWLARTLLAPLLLTALHHP